MGGMNYYWRNKEKFVNDDNIYVEFKTENDLLNALHKNIHYKDFKIKGIKRGDMWPVNINTSPQIDTVIEKSSNNKIEHNSANNTDSKPNKVCTQGSSEQQIKEHSANKAQNHIIKNPHTTGPNRIPISNLRKFNGNS